VHRAVDTTLVSSRFFLDSVFPIAIAGFRRRQSMSRRPDGGFLQFPARVIGEADDIAK
jgi:hypothetical protein